MVALTDVLADLAAECGSLDDLVADLPDSAWATATPASGWTIADQIGHLSWTDEQAWFAATEPAEFMRRTKKPVDGPTTIDETAHEWADRPPQDVLTRWRAGRQRLADALTRVPSATKLPWYGPPMSPASMATARMMETWAHGHDVADALGLTRPPTDRLRHIAHLAVRTRDFAFVTHHLTPPAEEFLVRLVGPSGKVWVWGSAYAAQSVTGTALDLCLVAAQRRHPDDTDLVATGPDAKRWLGIAQAFAGPPGEGRSATADEAP